MTIAALLDAAKKLALSDRLRLIGEVWESLGPKDADLSLSDAQAAELDRRLERLEREGSKDVPLDEFKRSLLDVRWH